MKTFISITILTTFASLAGCKSPEPQAPSGPQAAAATRWSPPLPRSADGATVEVDRAILDACGDVPRAYFAFDSSEIAPEARAALDAIARCFLTGPLNERTVKIVGHADPRGETEHNLALGQRRAGAVASHLARLGVEEGRLAPSSQGEFEATGLDEGGWARDRRVEILLAGPERP